MAKLKNSNETFWLIFKHCATERSVFKFFFGAKISRAPSLIYTVTLLPRSLELKKSWLIRSKKKKLHHTFLKFLNFRHWKIFPSKIGCQKTDQSWYALMRELKSSTENQSQVTNCSNVFSWWVTPLFSWISAQLLKLSTKSMKSVNVA